ncbi:peroxiredoxin [Cytobacillus depressus]|uniref:Peroxiredoxin n=1 Tax=Cytobacillus depressus TaxID=1602942 RepID=A0A6L3VAZ3_9BACI|nr:peroxiredoxin [Cytobacillus depressus]KAB2336682.1 peroxiredoxin [Cytobacillus depressus]
MLNIGTKAPDFKMDTVSAFSSLPIPTTLEQYKGKWLILFFYPFDFSIVCPTEVKVMNGYLPTFTELNTEVLAISTDSIFTHRAWLKADHPIAIGDIELTLASDYQKEVSKAYDVLDPQSGAAYRALYIIDPNGYIQYATMTNHNVGRSAAETVRVLQALQTGGMCPMDWTLGEKTIEV